MHSHLLCELVEIAQIEVVGRSDPYDNRFVWTELFNRQILENERGVRRQRGRTGSDVSAASSRRSPPVARTHATPG
jgi:hypothetical protein